MIRKIIFGLILLLLTTDAFAQRERLDFVTDSLVKEAKTIYRSEWASWYGTDIFAAKSPGKEALSGGYFSYETSNNLINIFFSKDANPVVIASVSFAKDFNSGDYKLDTIERPFNPTEQKYYTMRKQVVKRIYNDTTFKHFNNTTLNIVPIIQESVKKAYVLTGTSSNGVVIFGNDYLVNFDPGGEITSVKRLHKNIIPIYTKADSSGKTTLVTMHTHTPQTGDFMTATDICTLMLYEHLTPWNQHYVISKNDISIWDCKKNELLILTMEVWKKIQEDQKTRHPDQ